MRSKKMTTCLVGVLPDLCELQSDASPAAHYCDAAILLRLLLITVINVSSPAHLPQYQQ